MAKRGGIGGIGPVTLVITIITIGLMVGIGQYISTAVLDSIPANDDTTNETIANIKTQTAAAFNLVIVMMIVLAAVAILSVVVYLRYIAQ